MTEDQAAKTNSEKAPYETPTLQKQQRLEEILAGNSSLVTHGASPSPTPTI